MRLTAACHRPLATPAIRVEGISKRFSLGKQALQALDSVSFEVRRGSTHALVGESGSGKTTLARILLGFERADAGQVTIDGIDAGHLSREAQRQLRRKIQFVYQNPFASLDPRQTLFAIIEEPLKTLSASARRRVASVWRALPPGWPWPPSCCRVRRGSFPAASASGWRLPGR